MAEAKSKVKIEGVPEVNIGIVGHVDHGKTTLVQQLSGKWADTHSEEMRRGITIRLGYADTTFRKCSKCKEYTPNEKCSCGSSAKPVRTISFVDAPGHESLMATMLAGATIMDGAILLIAANEKCPQPQTREHLMALQISGIKNVVVVQNKVDLVDKERAMRHYQQIKDFLKNTEFKDSPIIPISAQHGVNLGPLIEAIEKIIPTPKRDEKADPMMYTARSFDVNKPGTRPKGLQGGVIGGAVIRGKLKIGDRIEIRPGRVVEEKNQIVAKPLFTKIIGLMTGKAPVKEITPGGSVGVLTELDSGIVRSDTLVGSVIGLPGKLPQIWHDLKLESHLLEKVLGSNEDIKVDPIKQKEILMLNVNSAATVGFVQELGKDEFKCSLKKPIAAEPGSRVTISRKIGSRFRLIGYGMIKE
ncbi:translation initiation factor IF-2 subunit gamma [Nanoarchaeota archaeon]